MINLRDIPMFKDAKTIERINIESRCKEKFKVFTENQSFFVKVEDSAYSDKDIEKVKWLYRTYEEEDIPTVPLIDVFTVGEETIWVFPFFEGQTLLEANIPLEKIEYYGKQVAIDIQTLNKKKPEETLFGVLDLKQHYEDRVIKIKGLLNQRDTRSLLLEIFDESYWQRLLDFYSKLFESIKNDRVMLNHNDIKLPNILINDDGNYYFIDLDPFDLTVVGYNIGYSISCFLFPEGKASEKTFLRAFIRTIDPDKKLINQMNYFLISDFINKIEKYSDMYKRNALFIESMLFNDDDLLSVELYK